MKKVFHKLSNIVAALAGISIFGLLIIIFSTPENVTIEGLPAVFSILCILILMIFFLFTAISFILACIDGWKQDKKAFLKKVLSQIMIVIIGYTVLCITDKDMEFNIMRMIAYGIVATIGIIGGEYMFKKEIR